MKLHRLFGAVAALLLAHNSIHCVQAQVSGVLNYWNVPTGNWNTATNWGFFSLPDGQAPQDDFAVIGGTTVGVGVSVGSSTVNTAIGPKPGGVALGFAAGFASEPILVGIRALVEKLLPVRPAPVEK